MPGYLIFGVITACFAAPFIAAGNLMDAAREADRRDKQAPSAAPIIVVSFGADTPETRHCRRAAAIRGAADWRASHGRK